ncbi:MAG: D-glycero-beta-D-manno-heptose 1-phosphate adenylyltransferase [Bacteroidota bacterium]
MSKLKKIQEKIISGEELIEKKIAGKVVFTNGCFDIIHRGHIEYLAKAADLGDHFVIGLNSDQSVRALKGPNRPVQTQESRASILASLFFVDYVIIFEEDTPANLIRLLQPDVLVKGGDYKAEEIVGFDTVTSKGGKVEIIDFVEGYSSTSILRKIRK